MNLQMHTGLPNCLLRGKLLLDFKFIDLQYVSAPFKNCTGNQKTLQITWFFKYDENRMLFIVYKSNCIV